MLRPEVTFSLSYIAIYAFHGLKLFTHPSVHVSDQYAQESSSLRMQHADE